MAGTNIDPRKLIMRGNGALSQLFRSRRPLIVLSPWCIGLLVAGWIVGRGLPITPAEWPFWPPPVFVDGADAVRLQGFTLDGYTGWGIMVRDCEHFTSIGIRITNGVAAVDGWYRFGWYFGGMQAPGVKGEVLIQDCEYRSSGATMHWENAITA